MPTVNLSKKTVLELLGKKIPDEELREKIPMLGVDLESVENDFINVEIFPNRPDMLSEQGFARALASFLGLKKGLREYKAHKSDYKVIVEPSVKAVRPFTVCSVVKNLKFDDEKIREVIQIQEKLHVTYGRNRKKCAIGVYPLEKIKFPITYLAKKPEDISFIPLESTKKMNGRQVLEQHPTGKEYGYLLEGKTVYPIFKDANNEILSMPPIINSHTVGKVTEKTTSVFIEVSGFDFDYLSKCMNMIVAALIDMGGTAYEVTVEYEKPQITPNMKTETIAVDIDYINKRLGLELKEKDMSSLMEKMGMAYSKGKVTIPSYRTDILHQIDIAEDVAIAYGYDNFEPIIPKVASIGEESRSSYIENRIRDVLIGLGLIEVKNLSLTNKDYQNKLSLSNTEVVELANSVSEEHNVLRAWILPSLLKNLQDNKKNEYPQNIFELGLAFDGKTLVETHKLCVCLAGKESDFTKIKQALDVLSKSLDFKYELSAENHSSFIPGRVGKIKINGKDAGVIGEIHPLVLDNFNLEVPICCLELNTEILY